MSARVLSGARADVDVVTKPGRGVDGASRREWPGVKGNNEGMHGELPKRRERRAQGTVSKCVRVCAVPKRWLAYRWGFLSFMLLAGVAAGAQPITEETLTSIRFDQKLNAQVSPELRFRDEEGKEVRVGQYFGSKPVVLVLGYYECPMLCTLVLNGMVESAADMKWSIGREFEVLNVSINPRETAMLAAAKKRSYVKRYGRSGCAAGWHFLTGQESAIRQLADAVGFHYVYDPTSKEYAHPSGLVVLTPEGKVSRYLFGVTYAPKDLDGALRAASSHSIGSPIQQLLLLCFHYNPIAGKYSGVIVVVLRVLGGATMAGMLALMGWLLWRGREAEAVLARGTMPSTRGSRERARSASVPAEQ